MKQISVCINRGFQKELLLREPREVNKLRDSVRLSGAVSVAFLDIKTLSCILALHFPTLPVIIVC
ncbi:hypothetical protein T11_4714 [Trichinella zimbabwensis]|uniref:Uncharacterized protein n=1 Tax=Trichinella zimbabwensis TaxID=268475 RepID=A0A0V1H5F4_9BILA|nr:hypothetical protein T11_4714 [Trichinella zimbabwensis]